MKKGFRRILIAVNNSLGVIGKGLALAESEKSWVTILKVLPPYEGELNLTGISNISDVLDAGAEKAAQEIEHIVSLNRCMANVSVIRGEIPECVSQRAELDRCDLVIIGAHKKCGPVARFVEKRVIGKIMDLVDCPVLVVET